MAVHKICDAGYRVGSCNDDIPHTDAGVTVVRCYAEHRHGTPFARAAAVLRAHQMPVPAHLAAQQETAALDLEAVARRLETATRRPEKATTWGVALTYAAAIVRDMGNADEAPVAGGRP